MIDILKMRLSQGRRTIGFPKTPPVLPDRFRGLPKLDPAKCGAEFDACAAACPAGALVFGDLKNPDSRVARLFKNQRGYRLLEELGTRPSVTYLADLFNPIPEADAS